MDVVRLGEYNNVDPSYLPDLVIDRYTSMVWTERFLAPGEFQLKTPYVDETFDLLPEKTLISHRDTREVMMVENHLITEDNDGNEELTISGRSVDFILESRFLESLYQKKRQMVIPYTAIDASLVLIWNAVANGTGWDVTRPRKDADPDDEQYHDGDRWELTLLDQLPNVVVSDSANALFLPPGWGDTERWWVIEGLLYDQLVKVLKKDDLGIRIVRPPSDPISLIEVDAVPPGFGEVVRTATSNTNALRFDVYKGAYKAHDATHATPIVFDVLHDDFDAPNHLWSIKDYKTAVEVLSSLNRWQDFYRPGESTLDGWDRRVTQFDAGSPELPDKPDYPGKNASEAQQTLYEERLARWKNRRDAVYDEFQADYAKDAKRLLANSDKVRLFSGNISTDTSIVYKEDYDLGDTVTLRGRRGLMANAVIEEYVRTDDAEGDRGFPSLRILD